MACGHAVSRFIGHPRMFREPVCIDYLISQRDGATVLSIAADMKSLHVSVQSRVRIGRSS